MLLVFLVWSVLTVKLHIASLKRLADDHYDRPGLQSITDKLVDGRDRRLELGSLIFAQLGRRSDICHTYQSSIKGLPSVARYHNAYIF